MGVDCLKQNQLSYNGGKLYALNNTVVVYHLGYSSILLVGIQDTSMTLTSFDSQIFTRTGDNI